MGISRHSDASNAKGAFMIRKTIALIAAFSMLLACMACTTAPAAPAAVPTATPVPAVADASSASGFLHEAGEILMATTTSVDNSGLLQYLAPSLLEDTGITMTWVSQGTGKAIQSAKDGNAGAILVHSKSQEQAMIDEGYGTERVYFMYNYFVIVGPEGDPANVKSAADAPSAFQAIKNSNSTFVSRGDESGTHTAELKIWKAAGVDTSVEQPITEPWYVSTGSGMGATLTVASEMQGYCFTDKATFLANRAAYQGMTILMEQSDALKNEYSFVRLNPEKLPNVDAALQDRLIEWFTSDRAAELIKTFGVAEYGEPLFFIAE